MKEIGGYMGLEFPFTNPEEFLHSDGVLLNTGTNAMGYIFKVKAPIHCVWLSYYTCECVLNLIMDMRLPYQFYRIDENMEIIFDSIDLVENDIVIYNNYFGIKDSYIKKLFVQLGPQLLIDNAQSYGSPYIQGSTAIYSPRKSFGVPDGGVAYVNNDNHIIYDSLEQDYSYDRFAHMLKRYELSASVGYEDFLRNGQVLMSSPMKKMSNLTKSLLQTFDYAIAQSIRQKNFRYLQSALMCKNPLSSLCEDIGNSAFPAFYPFYIKDDKLRLKLIESKIYVATYWPNVLKWLSTDKNSIEYKLAKNVIPIPIDQRYNEDDMDLILQMINQ